MQAGFVSRSVPAFERCIVVCLPIVGLILLGLSYAWPSLHPPSATRSSELGAELAKVDADLERLYKKLAEAKLRGVEIPAEPIPLKRLTEESNHLRRDLGEAAAAPQRTAHKLRLAGVASLLAGVAVYFHEKSRPSLTD